MCIRDRYIYILDSRHVRHELAERCSISDACCVDRLIDIFLANRFVGLPNRARQEATIDANIDPNPSRKRLRGTPNRPEIDPRTLSGRPVAPKSVRRASRECPGSVSGRPRHVPEPPRRSPRPPPGTRKSARERPGAHRGDQNRCQVASGIEEIKCVYLWRGACRTRRQSDLSTILLDFRLVREVREPSMRLSKGCGWKGWTYSFPLLQCM